jgi:hypothetical protein
VYVYVPKSWIIGFFCAAFGLAAGWLLHTSAQQVTSTGAVTSEAWNDHAASSAPPPGGSAPASRSTGMGPPPASAAAGRALVGDSTTSTAPADRERAVDPRLGSASGAAPPVGTPRGTTGDPASARGAPSPVTRSGGSAPSGAAPAPPGPAATGNVHGATPQDAGSLPFFSAGQAMFTVTSAQPSPSGSPMTLEIPPFLAADLFRPLPGAQSRGVAFSEWESYRTDLAGRNIIATTDDSNVFVNRNGKLNGNTGDTDASGLNIVDATHSVIHGTESADEAPFQVAAQAAVDIATGRRTDIASGADPAADEDDDGDANDPDPGANPEDGVETPSTAPSPATAPGSAGPVAVAASVDAGADEGSDFPYTAWLSSIDGGAATAVHTDEGTTLASGQDALVIGGDGYDDDDNRVTGEGIVLTRDDGNVVLGGTGDVNAQIGDSEQGAVIMDVHDVVIQGGGAY